MTTAQYERIWGELNRAGLLSGAWSGMALDEVPDEIRQAFYKALEAAE